MLRKHVTPSLVLSVVAVVLASAGTSVATVAITGKQVKDGSLTGADIRNHSLTAKDLKRGGVTRAAIARAAATDLQATPVTRVVTAQALATPPFAATLEARCPDGQVATGGGGGLQVQADQGDLRWSKPIMDDTGNPVGWIGRVVNNLGQRGVEDTAEVFAICTPGA